MHDEHVPRVGAHEHFATHFVEELHASPFGARGERGEALADERCESNLRGLDRDRAGLYGGEFKYVVDERAHALGVAAYDGEEAARVLAVIRANVFERFDEGDD